MFIYVAPPPSSPTIVSTTPQSTSITITWTQPEGDVVNSYEITYSYQGACPDVIPFESGSISGSLREFTAPDLHEFSNYTITIIASNGAGNSPPVTTTAETLPDGMMYFHGIFYRIDPQIYLHSSKWTSTVPHSHLYQSILHHHPVG